ncbi:X-ray repair cross-complementing protein 5-like [Dendronephthya gigantea]|uniref:X-ray repair cross-complementing protein 5-like n=1 Tax=Dendronephthya gigantea TaxID=151771 RepID=UPI00106CD50F|nr:X-ray repair cross-complementing protein 5-like [Dendronephthya gigantea]XP_028404244.1 X-ray repair cross-complementing protein 5-like [Dendronephthya gigantea]XP_028404245.1 X-ray repair cross-complementing protein 5-like [Dendronephthya gigantea]XP_028404246.1 X-ray repair cross-complementing protein 5-like [Dendronephthya gigantea]
MAGKTFLALILDVGPAMCQAPAGHETALETSVKAIKMILTRKMFTSPKDEIALVLFGAEETENELADGSGGYENIKVARKFACPDQDFLQYVHDGIVPGNEEADFVDAIVVATHLLNQATMGKKCGEKNMMMFSNFGSPFGDDGLEAIIDGIKNLETNFTVVGPNLHDDDDEDDGDNDSTNTQVPTNAGRAHRKPKTAQQKLGEECIKQILGEVEGQTFTLSDVLPMLAFVEKKAIKQTTTFRGPLQIGSNIKINVYGYIRVKEQKPDSWKKLSAPAEASPEPGDMGVAIQRTYHRDDEDETEVEKEDLAKGFRYGKTLVPFLNVDQQSIKLEAEKCLKVLCFTPSSCVKRHQYMGDSVVAFVPEPDDQAAAVGLSAIIRALYESDKVAIVRYVFRNNATPKIGFLSPHIKENYECLLFTALPFAEDIRQFTFASLPSTSKQEPTDEQMEAVDDFINSLILGKEKSDADEGTEDALKPKEIFNPYRQRLFQCIVHRTLNPGEPLPDIDPVIESSVQQPHDIQVQSAAHLEKLKELFPLEVVEKKKSMKDEENVFKTSMDLGLSDDGREAKRPKLAGDSVISMDDLTKSEVTEVGTVDPVGDFTYLVNLKDVDRFSEASKQMKDRILQLVLDSFRDEFYDKAMLCIHALRKESIKAVEGQMFNTFLEDLKEQLCNKASFWARIKEEKVTLINKNECGDVNITEEAAKSFLEDVTSTPEETPEEPVEDIDDLLEMMG